MMQEVRRALAGRGVVASTEAEFSRHVGAFLRNAGLEVRSEVQLSDEDRIDYMVGDIGVELKIKGSTADVLRQLDRYAAHDEIGELALVTSSRRLATGIPSVLRGKTITVVYMGAL